MGDDDAFWHGSAHSRFEFGEINTWAESPAAPKLSAAVWKISPFDVSEFEEFHRGGIQEIAEKEVTSLPSPGLSHDVSSESFKSLLMHGDVLRLNQEEKEPTSGRTSADSTVRNMLLGFNFCLEQHKAMDEKLALLEAAVKSHDGNAIIAVVLFLRNTLRKSIFHRELLKQIEAVNHYVHYLELDHEYDELANMLLMLGRGEDAAMLKYKSAIKEQNPSSKIKKLENCLNTHFQITCVSPVFADSLSEHISLLQRQLPIEADDVRQEKEESNRIFQLYPRKHSLFDVSIITTLFYCCLYHYNLSENNLASPSAIRKQHQITDKQFTWTALLALAQLKNWGEIENLFVNKGWLGSTKLKCCIGFNKVVPVLFKSQAPHELIVKYIKLVDDSDEKLVLAKKYKYHKLVLEILMHARDRQGLIAYKSELSPKGLEYIEVEEVLHSSNSKWKN